MAASYEHLGIVEYDMGNYKVAKEFYEESLAIRIATFGTHTSYLRFGCASNVYLHIGEGHAHVAASYNCLGAVESDMGHYQEAKECHLKSYDIRIAALGTTYSALSRSDLSILYVGEGHPAVATSCNNLGDLERCLGNYSKAKEWHLKSLNIRITALGMVWIVLGANPKVPFPCRGGPPSRGHFI